MPTKPTHVEITSVGSQSDRRSLVTFRDQHRSSRFQQGRPFWGYLEMPSDPVNAPGPVGELLPGDAEDPFGGAWEAPWMPAPPYMELNLRKLTITINYPKMIADFKRAMEEHYRKATEVAYEKNWPEPRWLGPIDHNIRHVIGRVPLSHKIPEAAMAGDPWLLGLSDQPNEKLQAILDTYNRQNDLWQTDDSPAVPVASAVDLSALVAQQVADALAGLGVTQPKKGKANQAEAALAAQPG